MTSTTTTHSPAALLAGDLLDLTLPELAALTDLLLDRQAALLDECPDPSARPLFRPAANAEKSDTTAIPDFLPEDLRAQVQAEAAQAAGTAKPTRVEYSRDVERLLRKASSLADRMAHHIASLYDSENPQDRVDLLGLPRGKTAFTNSADFVGQTLAVSKSTITKRIRRGRILSPDSWLTLPGFAALARSGDVDPEIVDRSVDAIGRMRSAARRAGSTSDEADDLVAAQEQEFLDRASTRDPKSFADFAVRQRKAYEQSLLGPEKELTPSQVAVEEGLVYQGPVGSSHHRWTYTTDELGHERLRRVSERGNQSRRAPLTPQTQATEDSDPFDQRSSAQRAGDLLGEMIDAGLVLDADHDPEAESATQPDTPERRYTRTTGTELNVIVSLHDLRHGAPDTNPPDPPDPPGTQLPFTRAPDTHSSSHNSRNLTIGQLRQLACDATIIPHVLGSRSEPLDVGRAHYSVPKPLQRAVFVRDRGCAAPGCTRSLAWSEIHHIHHWANGGETAIDNLVLLCAHHHSAVHQNQLEVMMIDRIPHFRLTADTDPSRTWHRNYHWRQ